MDERFLTAPYIRPQPRVADPDEVGAIAVLVQYLILQVTQEGGQDAINAMAEACCNSIDASDHSDRRKSALKDHLVGILSRTTPIIGSSVPKN